ncbi:MAG: ABC transporter substrate-binding protein [Solirubrobacteraceae bacterium]|nr:ABC transporter substrate-binding protein [Solirubrobacteraceae bacterium]
MSRTTSPARALLASLAVLSLISGLAACGGDDTNAGANLSADESSADATTTSGGGSPDLSKVTLRVGVQKDGIRAVLGKTGALDDAPYKVEFSTFQFGPPLVEAAGADKIDLAWVGNTPPLFGAAAGSNFKIIAAVREYDSQENSLLVHQGSTIKDFKDLVGKKVAVPKGSSANGYLFSGLKREGVDPKQVKLVYLPPADGLAAFTSGRVDAWVVWDPFVQQAEATAGAVAVQGGEPDEHGIGFQIASSKALEDPAKRAVFTDYLKRLQGAWAWARKNPDGWAAAWSKDSGLPLAVTKKAARAKSSHLTPIDDEVAGYEQTLADLLNDEGVLPKAVDFKSIVDPGVFEGTS